MFCYMDTLPRKTGKRWSKVTKPPTDLKMLSVIYKKYYETFINYSEDDGNRSSKIYVPIDVDEVANEFNLEGDIVFGKLYYHLDKKYGYRQEDDRVVHLFAMFVGEDRHCVNFPYLASILAALQEENKKYRVATAMSVISLFVASVSLILSVFL